MHSFPLPPEDRLLSPYTGWTRGHWEAAADGLLSAVAPHAGPHHALINLPGSRPSWSGPRSDGLEGYARTFLLAALRVAGARGDDPGGLLDRYAEGLAAGTRSPTTAREVTAADGESWPAVTDRGQAIPEASSIATALRITRPWLWDRLDPAVRENAAAWLAEALRHEPVDNNWWLFPLTVGGFLAEVGLHVAAAQEAVRRGLAAIDPWYTGDGWYTDGRPRAFDHYNGWALHLLPVLHAHLSGDAALTETYGGRLASFLDGYARTFGADGAPLHQGRSLIYRFAAAAPLWAGALTGHTPLSPGTTRRLASGALRYFLDRGATEPGGLLSLGWFGACPRMAQPYSGPASPYWASKGFLGLLLPPDHAVWTATEEAAPSETADTVLPLPGPGWLIQSTAADGLVRAHNHGSDDQPADEVLPDAPYYARLAYSTATGPALSGPADNHFGIAVGNEVSERGRIRPLGAGDGWAASRHRPRIGGAELPDVIVVSLTLASGADEVHAHLLSGVAPGTPVRLTGWAVAGDVVECGAEGVRAWARAGEPPLTSQSWSLHGFTTATTADLPAGTVFGPVGGVPVLIGAAGNGPELFVSAARLTGTGAARRAHVAAEVARSPGGHRLVVTWPDGGGHEAQFAADGAGVAVRRVR